MGICFTIDGAIAVISLLLIALVLSIFAIILIGKDDEG